MVGPNPTFRPTDHTYQVGRPVSVIFLRRHISRSLFPPYFNPENRDKLSKYPTISKYQKVSIQRKKNFTLK